MKVIKIKRLKDKDNILINLKKELRENDFTEGNWIYPTINSYIIINDNKIIPCYITIKDNEAISLWVSLQYRKQGYVKFLVSSLNIKYATALPSSLLFWKSLGFKEIAPFKMKR